MFVVHPNGHLGNSIAWIGLCLWSQGFYDEVSSPLLLDVDLRYPDNAVDFLTQNRYNQLFNGSEIVVSGQLTSNDPENFLVEVFAKGVSKGPQCAITWARHISYHGSADADIRQHELDSHSLSCLKVIK